MSQILSRTNKNQEKCPEGDSRPFLVKNKTKQNTRETSQVQVLDKVSVLESPGLHVMSTCLQGSQPEPKCPRPKALFILKKVFEEIRDVTRHHSWVGKHRSDWPACPPATSSQAAGFPVAACCRRCQPQSRWVLGNGATRYASTRVLQHVAPRPERRGAPLGTGCSLRSEAP